MLQDAVIIERHALISVQIDHPSLLWVILAFRSEPAAERIVAQCTRARTFMNCVDINGPRLQAERYGPQHLILL